MIQLRNPDPTKKAPRMKKETYAIAHRTALAIVPKGATGITLTDFRAKLRTELPKAKGWDSSASASWWSMAIKLDMEARGELKRVKGTSPQRLVRG